MLLTVQHLETDEVNPDRLVFRFDKFSLRHRLGLMRHRFGEDWRHYKNTLLDNGVSIEFRDRIFKKIRAGDNVLAVLPRGSGKSFNFWLPVASGPGLILVIGSLHSLIRDHKMPLKIQHRLHSTGFTDSAIRGKARNVYYPYIELGKIRLLYIDPENLKMKDFENEIRKNIGGSAVNALIIDDAHCVSEWGGEFRPSFLKIPEFVSLLKNSNPNLTIVGFTAMTGNLVKKDILGALDLREGDLEFVRALYRSNISHQVVEVDGYDEKADAYEQIIVKDIPNALNKKSFHDIFADGKGEGSVFCIYADSYGMDTENDGVAHYLNETRKILAERTGFLGEDASSVKKHKPLKLEYDYTYSVSSDAPQKAETGDSLSFPDGTPKIGGKSLPVDKENVRFVIHMSMAGSLENWLREIGQAGRDGRRAHCVQIVDMPCPLCEEDLITRKTNVPKCTGSHCEFGKGELCDYGKQHLYISKNSPSVEIELIQILATLDRLIATQKKNGDPLRIESPAADEKRTDLSLYRLASIGVIGVYTFDFGHGEPAFEISGFSAAIDDDAALSGVLNFLKTHDLSYHHKFSDYAPADLARETGEITAVRHLYGEKIKARLVKAINDGHIANYAEHRELFERTADCLLVILHHVYDHVRRMRYRMLWNVKEFLAEKRCRTAAFLKHFISVGEDWKCGMCDRCVPDLKFGQGEPESPRDTEETAELDTRFRIWLEQGRRKFDPEEAEKFKEHYQTHPTNLYLKCGNILEDSPNDIKALYLSREFSPDRLKTKNACSLMAVANRDLEMRTVARLYETSPEDLDTRSSLLDIMDSESGAFNSEEGESLLYEEARKILGDAERTEILGARVVMNRLKTLDLKPHKYRLTE